MGACRDEEARRTAAAAAGCAEEPAHSIASMKMARTPTRLLALAALTAALAACGGGSDGGGAPAAQGGGTPPQGGGPATGTQTLTLDWDGNTEADLAGYRIYRSTVSGSYQAAIATVPPGTTTYTATGLQSRTTYFFVVTATNTSLGESVHSNEVSKTFQ